MSRLFLGHGFEPEYGGMYWRDEDLGSMRIDLSDLNFHDAREHLQANIEAKNPYRDE